MRPTDIILPVAGQALLTIVVLVAMGPARARSMRESGRTLSDEDVRLGRITWDARATKIANNYANQFEVPVLFYACAALALSAGAVDLVMLTLAWVFVGSRVAHSIIHIGPNVLPWRGAAFLVGVLVVVTMWVKLALHVL